MIRLALIGAGRWGKNILRTLDSIPECEVVSVITSTPTPLRGTYKTVEELIKDARLDGVCIATPASTHADIALPFISNGIPTFIEKPMTTSLESAQKLADAARARKTIVFVGHIHLYNPAYLVAKEQFGEQNVLRTLYFEGKNNGPYRNDMSALWDWAPHDIAMSIDLVGEAPTTVQSWELNVLRPSSSLADAAQLRLLFANGIESLVSVSWLFPVKQKRMVAIGSQDSVIYDDTTDAKVALYRGMGPSVEQNEVTAQEPSIVYPSYSSESPLDNELRAFLDAIRGEDIAFPDIEHAMTTMRVLDAANRSARNNGVPISL